MELGDTMFDDLKYLMDKAMSTVPPGTIDPNKLEEDLKRSRASNQANPNLVQLAQSNLPLESFVRLAAQQPRVEKPTNPHINYDQESAEEFEASTGMSLYDPDSNRWASRIFMGPNNGLILKSETHKTFGRTIRGEKKVGTTLFRRKDHAGNQSKYNGRLYSFLPNESYDPSIYSPIPEEEINKWFYSSYDIGDIAQSILPFEVAESNPESWGYDPDSQTFFPYDDSRGNLTAGIGGKIDGDRENTVRAQLAIVAPEIDYDDFKAGQVGLTRPQVDQMFVMNVKEHIKTAEGLKVKLDDGITVYPFENLHEFPSYMQEAVVNGVFWSMLTPAKSPNTMRMIARGDWEGASKEFLDGKWQREQKAKNGSTWQRFVLISDALDRYGKELKGTEDSGYIMQKGDTLWGVSQDLGMTTEELQEMNPGLDPTNIPVGYRLKTKAAEAIKYGQRVDGTMKGSGFLGPIKMDDGRTMTELSIGVEFDGKETLIPAIVPTLTEKEINHLKGGGKITDEIFQKAVDHAKQRMSNGLSPFKEISKTDNETFWKDLGIVGGLASVGAGGLPEDVAFGMTEEQFAMWEKASTPETKRLIEASIRDNIHIAQTKNYDWDLLFEEFEALSQGSKQDHPEYPFDIDSAKEYQKLSKESGIKNIQEQVPPVSDSWDSFIENLPEKNNAHRKARVNSLVSDLGVDGIVELAAWDTGEWKESIKQKSIELARQVVIEEEMALIEIESVHEPSKELQDRKVALRDAKDALVDYDYFESYPKNKGVQIMDHSLRDALLQQGHYHQATHRKRPLHINEGLYAAVKNLRLENRSVEYILTLNSKLERRMNLTGEIAEALGGPKSEAFSLEDNGIYRKQLQEFFDSRGLKEKRPKKKITKKIEKKAVSKKKLTKKKPNKKRRGLVLNPAETKAAKVALRLLDPKANLKALQKMRAATNTKTGKAGGAAFFLYSMIGLLRSIEEGDTKDLTEGWQGPWFREWMKGIAEMQLGGAESVENMTIDNLMYYITSIYKPKEQLRILSEIPKSLKDVFVEPLLWAMEKLDQGSDTPSVTSMNSRSGQSTPSGQYPPSVQE